jgi:PERQ amino acid-rich with GYF domain-containing protein
VSSVVKPGHILYLLVQTTATSNEITPSWWTTVGPSGKTSLASSRSNIQQSTPAASPSTQSVLTSQRSSNMSTAVNRVPSSSASKATSVRVEERRHDPSLEFLRWLRDSLKGLNAGVNGEKQTGLIM